jgi:hypothetical protein
MTSVKAVAPGGSLTTMMSLDLAFNSACHLMFATFSTTLRQHTV